MDWPLSREEKKCQAIHLYERDVQTCNQLLESKDRALDAAREEIKALRRASTASTTTTTACGSSPDESQVDIEDDNEDHSPQGRRTGEDASEMPVQQMVKGSATCNDSVNICESQTKQQDVDALQKVSSKSQRQRTKCRTASPDRHPTSQRSSSLEVVSSWLPPAWKKVAEADGVKGESNLKSKPERSDARVASPRRHPTMRRSNSLEAASSLWGSAWKAVRNGAKRASETATETARILADEARLTGAEALDVLGVGSRNHDLNSHTGHPSGNSVKSAGATESIEWHVDLEPDSGSVGLKLEPYVKGKPRRVQDIAEGMALHAWNSSKVPVTVFLHPGRREAVMRRITVLAGDELIAIDGEPLEQVPQEVELIALKKLTHCKALTFRRRVPQRASAETGP